MRNSTYKLSKKIEGNVKSLVLKLITESAIPLENSMCNKYLKELKQTCIDPGIIEKMDNVSDTNELKIQSRIINDALESVTNGMYNPDFFTSLNQISEQSPFYSWKSLILAINYMYKNDAERFNKTIDQIEKETPPYLLVPVLKSIVNENEITKLNLTEIDEYLKKKIIEKPNFLSSALEQINESIENKFEDVFIDTVTLLIKDISAIDLQSSKSLSIWAFETALNEDLDPERLLLNFKTIFGEYEAYHLAGIATLNSDPDLSLFFWLKFFQILISEQKPDLNTIEDFFEIILDLIVKIKQYEDDLQIDNSYWESYLSIQKNIYSVLKKYYPEKLNIITYSHKIDFIYKLNEILFGKKKKNNLTEISKIEKKNLLEPFQLELF